MKWAVWLVSNVPDWKNLSFDSYDACFKAWAIWEVHFQSENPLIKTGLRCVFGPESVYGS